MPTAEVERIFGLGVYSPAEAARYARFNQKKITNWSFGWSANGKHYEGFLDPDLPRVKGSRSISFLTMIEFCLIQRLSENPEVRISTQKVRKAAEAAVRVKHIHHPFAWKWLRTDGQDFFALFGSDPDNCDYALQLTGRHGVDEHADFGQFVFATIVEPFFKEIDFVGNYAGKWYPLAREEHENRLVVLDPEVRFGAPTIAGTRVPTAAIEEQRHFDIPADEIAAWYGITVEQVEAAWEFERTYPRAA